MTRVEALAAEIREYCASHADRKQARRWERYFTEGYDAWGLLDKNHPLWHQKQAEWLEGYRDIGLRGFLKLGEILFRSGKYEEGALAIRFAVTFRDQFDQKAVERLGKWFEAGIRNWAHTDVLCGEIIAPLLESGRVGLETLAPWRESELKFQRRAVPVAMLRLLKVKPDAGPLLEFIRPMMTDPERVVGQGLGWFLRETWKKHPRPVEAFLLEWKDEAARVIFQYATEKMAPEARARFRRAKPGKRS
ncbi:MAG: DNA alkylation repair protein [Bryobacteraceae bacterium]